MKCILKKFRSQQKTVEQSFDLNLSGQNCIESLGQQQKIVLVNNDLYFATVVSDILRIAALDVSGKFLKPFT